jgi:ferrous iron transport protein B
LKNQLKIALAGNPNTGKTSLFNELTGLRHKVGNYPGITVEKKEGVLKISEAFTAIIYDLPGTYSLHPTSVDEQIVFDVLLDEKNPDFPDVVLYIAEPENLKRNLFLFSQIKDLGLPVVLVINMIDKAPRKGIEIDLEQLSAQLDVPVLAVSTRKGTGIEELKKFITTYPPHSSGPLVDLKTRFNPCVSNLVSSAAPYTFYKNWLLVAFSDRLTHLPPDLCAGLRSISEQISNVQQLLQKEAIYRYQKINRILENAIKVDRLKGSDLRAKLDRVFIHPIFGYVIFILVMILIFQSIFSWASRPMDWIDQAFGHLSAYLGENLPKGKFTDLITEGIVPGIGGIVIFIPQIALLIFFISILEESGYMSRVVFLMDKIMRRYGMSGKSVLPLLSGTACAIPAIMATRTIENWRERLITIFVIPFTTCSARLPVYAILISLIIPRKYYFGFLNLQGLVMLGMYALGFLMAFVAANLLNKILKRSYNSIFVVELPEYQLPLPKNVLYSVWDKTKSFVLEAGKIILSISIILWFLASNGGNEFKNARETAFQLSSQPDNQYKTTNAVVLESAIKLEQSYLGRIGKSIEPLIAPLGYDWKIGIALLSSFAAREVFVGTLATIYSVADADDENANTIRTRLQQEVRPDGTPVFNLATGISLLLFYAFAMQCMSTLAIVQRETNSWRWPLIQLVSMSSFAYLVSLIAYQLLHT